MISTSIPVSRATAATSSSPFEDSRAAGTFGDGPEIAHGCHRSLDSRRPELAAFQLRGEAERGARIGQDLDVRAVEPQDHDTARVRADVDNRQRLICQDDSRFL